MIKNRHPIYLASSKSEAVTKIQVQTVIDAVILKSVVVEKVVRKGVQKPTVILTLCLLPLWINPAHHPGEPCEAMQNTDLHFICLKGIGEGICSSTFSYLP